MSLHLIFWATPPLQHQNNGSPKRLHALDGLAVVHPKPQRETPENLHYDAGLLGWSSWIKRCLRCLVLPLFFWGGVVVKPQSSAAHFQWFTWNSGYLKKSLLFASPQFAGWTWTRDKSWASFLVPFSNLWASSNLALLSCSFKHLKDHGKAWKSVVWLADKKKKRETACVSLGLAKTQQLYVRTRHWRCFSNVTRWQLGHFQGGSVGLV